MVPTPLKAFDAMKSYTNLMTVFITLRQHTKLLPSLMFGRSFCSEALSIYSSSTRQPQACSTLRRLDRDQLIARRTFSFCNTRCFSLRNSDSNIMSEATAITMEIDVDGIADMLRTTYDSGETDKVQDEITSKSVLSLLFYSKQFKSTEEIANHLIRSAIQAATDDNRLNRGVLSAILNAILASCCVSTSADNLSNNNHGLTIDFPLLAWKVLQQMDEMHSENENTMVSPDLVTLSLVYYSCCAAEQSDHSKDSSDFYSDVQATVLERAQRIAKKVAGSSRRKALAAERRRRPTAEASNLSVELQSLYGPDISVLHEDDDLLVLSKPSGMVCYHNKKTSAGKITTSRKKKSKKDKDEMYGSEALDVSLEDALLDMAVPLSTINPTARGIVHRIDRGTSGTIVLAKNDHAHMRLVALFFLRIVKKKYLALVPARSVDGELQMASHGAIHLNVDGRPAFSTYEVLGMYTDTQGSEPTAILLEVRTLTGRKHQVRVHCANGLKRPIFLDPLYSNHCQRTLPQVKDKKNKQNLDKDNSEDETIPVAIRQAASKKEQFFLHANTLSIPALGIHVESPLPTWWNDILEQWK